MDYSYDVFISYKNQDGLLQWVGQHFQPMLQRKLSLALPRQAAVFRDKTDIKAGDIWGPAIQESLKASRLIVAVLTPQYFTSKWCMAEWESMVKRELLLAKHGAHRLLVPIVFSNGEFFPGHVTDAKKGRQCSDFKSVANDVIPPGSQREADLETKVDTLVQLLVPKIQSVPKFQPAFPIADPAKVKLPKLPPGTSNFSL